MKIHLVSDLHLEFADIKIENLHGADVLILAGDILLANSLYEHPHILAGQYNEYDPSLGRKQVRALRFRNFLQRISSEYKNIIYIAGNHEFYGDHWNRTLTILKNECDKFTNIYFLENGTVDIDGVTFVGATLWTDMNRNDPITLHMIRNYMNDFRVIRDDSNGYSALKPETTVIRHRNSLEFINQSTKDVSKKYVIVGHHAPSQQSIHESFKNEYLGNGAFASNLDNFIIDNPQIKLWVHGHMHNVFDYKIGDTRVVCNPRGYPNENTGWNPHLILEV